MNSRDRFVHCMQGNLSTCPPLFEDGVRDETLRLWRRQGLGKREQLEQRFYFDKREELEPDLAPIPYPSYWPKTIWGLENFFKRLDPADPNRLPENWEFIVREYKQRDYPLILRVHRGYFLTMGVHGWSRFSDSLQLLIDQPRLVETWLNRYGEFIAALADRILQQVDVDAALFSEPIGGNHGPLISPAMYERIVLKSYQPILSILNNHGIKTIIYRTYANTRALLPAVIRNGFSCLWACETNPEAMNYRSIRSEFGKDLHLIGGIDSDSLRQSREEIFRSVMEVVPGLIEKGGYIPLADGRVRDDVPFDSYVYYRELLESLTR